MRPKMRKSPPSAGPRAIRGHAGRKSRPFPLSSIQQTLRPAARPRRAARLLCLPLPPRRARCLPLPLASLARRVFFSFCVCPLRGPHDSSFLAHSHPPLLPAYLLLLCFYAFAVFGVRRYLLSATLMHARERAPFGWK